GLPRGHPDRLEYPEVVYPVPGAEDYRVEHAEPGGHRDQQGQRADQGGEGQVEGIVSVRGGEELREQRVVKRVRVGACVGAGPQADVVLLHGEARGGAAEGLPAGEQDRLPESLRVESLADDPCADLLAAEGEGDGVADGLAGLGEEAGV